MAARNHTYFCSHFDARVFGSFRLVGCQQTPLSAMQPAAAAPSGTSGIEIGATRSKRYGPEFVRNTLIELESLSVFAGVSGWRDGSPERIKVLATIFVRGGFGFSILGTTQILEKEHDGKKIIDDVVSTVSALLWCKERRRVC